MTHMLSINAPYCYRYFCM